MTLTEMTPFGSAVYSVEELMAEMGSAYLCLCATSGILRSEIHNTVAYLQNWLSVLQNEKKFVIQAAAQAQKAVDFILGIPMIENDA